MKYAVQGVQKIRKDEVRQKRGGVTAELLKGVLLYYSTTENLVLGGKSPVKLVMERRIRLNLIESRECTVERIARQDRKLNKRQDFKRTRIRSSTKKAWLQGKRKSYFNI
ncbi:hypothetical protein ACTXT7_001535 [Hymenolepis weldensis]